MPVADPVSGVPVVNPVAGLTAQGLPAIFAGLSEKPLWPPEWRLLYVVVPYLTPISYFADKKEKLEARILN